MAITLTASPTLALSPNRLVVVIAQPGDPRAARQNAALQRDAAALRERDVLVQNFAPEAARRKRPEWRLSEWRVDAKAAFEVLLIGKDGEVKLRRKAPVAPSKIAAFIDTMPMRQQEMKRRKSAKPGPGDGGAYRAFSAYPNCVR